MRPVSARSDNWPHTRRLLPWLIAAFLAMIFLVPFDSIRLPLSLPVDSTPDRFLLPVMVVVWLCGAFATRKAVNPLPRTWISFAVGSFVAIAVASILVNVGQLQMSGDLQAGWKLLALLVSYVAFFIVVATSVRRAELQNFGTLVVVLACITALGTAWEYRTGYNVFRSLSETLAPGGTYLEMPAEAGVVDSIGRSDITGPAQHGLAVCVMMAFALPIAIVRIFDATGVRKIVWGAAACLILIGGIATLRKTAVVLPVAVFLAMLAYRPKPMLRTILPMLLALLLFVQVLAPGALGSFERTLSPGVLTGSSSTEGRVSDYGAVRPDVLDHPVLGRGFGTYLPEQSRYLDNEYLKRLVETGALGAVAYLLMIVAVMSVAHRSVNVRDPVRSGAALAVSAGALAYGVAGLLFDEFFFPQAPYLFFFAAAVAAVVAAPRTRTAPDRSFPAAQGIAADPAALSASGRPV